MCIKYSRLSEENQFALLPWLAHLILAKREKVSVGLVFDLNSAYSMADHNQEDQ